MLRDHVVDPFPVVLDPVLKAKDLTWNFGPMNNSVCAVALCMLVGITEFADDELRRL